ncbi:hypothetical protein [Vreelandella zhanjiangensis]|uniref:hypothetical protein n=1 Tax=Vreelandella zhanjiangensis TaxID=1121960 RepID=UPI00036E8EF8|nr:hypothetical protein [Halomonas zhanjiangensis]
MNLNFTVLNGPRKETQHNLSSKTPGLYFYEDEALLITLEIAEFSSEVYLCLHENEIRATEYMETDTGFKYIWRPVKHYKWGHEKIFHNFCGYAEISVKHTSHENEVNVFTFSLVEILARKITSESVTSMLSFLSEHGDETLSTLLRVTRFSAGLKEGHRSISFLIEQIEKNVLLLNSKIASICANPITKNNLNEKINLPSERTLFDDNSLAWLCENLDSLYETDDYQEAFIEWEGKLYTSHKIREIEIEKNHDTYENQVILGFIETLINTTNYILIKLDDTKPKNSINSYNEQGYISFFSQIRKFKREINKSKIKNCRNIINQLHAIKDYFLAHLKITSSFNGMPNFTYKAKEKNDYFLIFKNIANWYRFGAADLGIPDELSSIQNIPKLFEYYCFIRLKLSLENLGFIPEDINTDKKENGVSYYYKLQGYCLALRYEPVFWADNNKRSGKQEFVNIEAWTVDKRNIKERSKNSSNSKRCPDFVIELTKGSENKMYYLDAKYTNRDTAFTNYLPDLTMKYIHGIGSKNSAESPSLGLSIIYPDEVEKTISFHEHEYSIFGSKPILPALNITSIKIYEQNHKESEFNTFINKILLFMKNSLVEKTII